MFCGLPLRIQRHSLYAASMILGIALFLGSAVVPPAYAPTIIAFDAAFSSSCIWPSDPCETTLTWSHTVSSAKSDFGGWSEIENPDFPPPDVASISYRANSLTLYASSPLPYALAWMYVLLDPPVGTATVTVTFTGKPEENAAGGSVSYFNVEGVGSYSQNHGFGGSASLPDVGSIWGNGIVVDLLRALPDAAPISQGSGQTLRWQQPTVGAMSDKITTTPTTTMTWTLAGGYEGEWDMVGIGLLPAQPPSPVGGFMEPVNKLAILAPYLILFGLVATVAIVVVRPWKKPEN